MATAGSSQYSYNSLDALVGEITSTTSFAALDKTLRNYGTKETRETLLVGALSGGQDPLNVLDVQVNTLGYLYILSARFTAPSAHIPSHAVVSAFCRLFDPQQARLAPERVTLLGRGILRVYDASKTLDAAIQPLHDLLTRYAPSSAHLTPIHPLFLRACVASRRFAAALPVLRNPLTDVSTRLDLNYNDALVYHYAGGIALAALRRWAEAEQFFEIAVSVPAQAPAALQLEALRKLVLVQLILYGKVKDIGKVAQPTLVRMVKNSSYGALVNAYPKNASSFLEKEGREKNFEADKNLGLVKLVLERAPRWCIKRLTETYITLSLSEIGKEVGISDVEAAREIVLSMIEQGDVHGKISVDGTVTFEDPEPDFSASQLAELLAAAQEQGATLAELDREMLRSREYIGKALKSKEEGWGRPDDDEMWRMDKESAWVEESLFS